MFILLTGREHTGKTTACWKALPGLRASGVKIAGFVSPPLLDACGIKVGIEMVDLSTGEHQTFARKVEIGDQADIGSYRLVEGAIDWARKVLSAALLANVEWLVVDEIGPLELRHGQGFAFALAPLSDPVRVPNAIVLVREGLAGELAERIGRPDMVRLHVTQDNRRGAPEQLLRLVGAAG